MPEQKRQNLVETSKEPYYNQQQWVEEFLDDNDAFYNGSESDDGDNDHENFVCRDENFDLISIRKSSQMFSKLGVLKNFANTFSC